MPRTASHRASAFGSGDAERGQPVGDRRVWRPMQRARGKRLELGFVKSGRAVGELRKVDEVRQFVERGDRTHRLGRTNQHRERGDGERLDAFRAQRADRQRARALGQSSAASVGQEVVVAEARRCARERLENLDLHGGIGDVILAANDMRHAEIDVVDHRGQRVEIGSILAAEDRIGERRAIDVAFAAHHVVPAHGRRFEAKTPMRLAA